MRFTPLSETSGFAFPAGAFDVRGWEVRTMADGARVGEVDDILLDDAGAPRYLDVDLGVYRKHVLVPIGQARVDEAGDTVWVPGMTRAQFEAVPEYGHDASVVTREYEERLSAAYAVGPDLEVGGAERADEAPASPAPRVEAFAGRLSRLSDLDDFRVAHGDPNPLGWSVVASDDRTLGTVSELIVDTTARKVRYLECSLESPAVGGSGRRVLIPIGYARLDEEGDRVIVDAITSVDAAGLPTFRELPVTRAYEEDLHRRFTGGTRGERTQPQSEYEVERFYGGRRSADGGEPEA